jgi:uncharacterized phosphosugar-binding protein
MMIDGYFEKLQGVLERIRTTQRTAITQAAEVAQRTIEAGGIIYIFGCGHSHLIALDNFYRAGGLCNVCPILDADLMLHDGAAKSSKMEKMSGLAEPVLERYCLTEKDCLFVISTSGKNAVPVEMSQAAKARGIPTVAVVSGAYFNDPSTMPKLYECVPVYIDNCVPHGDAVMELPGCDAPMGSVSTAASAFILQSVLLEAASGAAKNGVKPPVYLSGNIPGGAEFNKALIRQYMPRIKHL